MRYEDVEWHAAACKGIPVELFYIETIKDAVEFVPQLRAVCENCPIYSECMEYALENEVHGFWGGLTATQRMRLRPRWKRERHAA